MVLNRDYIEANDGWEVLQYAIVEQAVEDYKKSMVYLVHHKRPKRIKTKKQAEEAKMWDYNQKMRKDCERFFRSNWYAKLTDIDGERVIQELRDQIRYRAFAFEEET